MSDDAVVSRIFRTFDQATAPVVSACSSWSGAMFMYLRVAQLLPAMCLNLAAAVLYKKFCKSSPVVGGHGKPSD